MAESPDERADRLAALAIDLVNRVRDDDPNAVNRWLCTTLGAADRHGLLFVLAAAVPDDRPFRALTAWTLTRRSTPTGRVLAPCGTPAAAARHRARGETVDADCEAAQRAYHRDRKREQRAQRREAA